MTPYNTTFLDNTSGPLAIIQGIQQNEPTFGGLLLIFTFFILYATFRKAGSNDAFLGASFVTCILAGLAFGFGALQSWTLIFPVTILVASIIAKVWGDG